MWNSYQLLQKVNQPLSLQNNCTAMLDNHTKAMVETDHASKLICIFNKAMLFCMALELLQMSVINLLSYQSFNHLFKQKPPKRQEQKMYHTLHIKPLFQSVIYCEITVILTRPNFDQLPWHFHLCHLSLITPQQNPRLQQHYIQTDKLNKSKKFSSLWHRNIISTFMKGLIFAIEIACLSTGLKSDVKTNKTSHQCFSVHRVIPCRLVASNGGHTLFTLGYLSKCFWKKENLFFHGKDLLHS